MSGALYVVIDVTSRLELPAIRDAARRILLNKLTASPDDHVALTLVGTPTTNNELAAMGDHCGYEHISTVCPLGPGDTGILEHLEAVALGDAVYDADVVSAVVLALYCLQQLQRQSGGRVLLLCDAGQFLQTSDDDEDQCVTICEQFDALDLSLTIVSPSSMPKIGMLRKLCDRLGSRFEFQELHGTAGGVTGEATEEQGALPGDPDELRIDWTDGNAYTRDGFIEFYGVEGGIKAWEAAEPAPADPSTAAADDADHALGAALGPEQEAARLELATRALRAHLVWSRLDKEKKYLRSFLMPTADKAVREGMAQHVAAASAPAPREPPRTGITPWDAEEEEDTFGEWDLRAPYGGSAGATGPAAGVKAVSHPTASLHPVMQQGDAFSVTGALVPADVADARAAGAAMASAAAAPQAAVAVDAAAEALVHTASLAAAVDELGAALPADKASPMDESDGAQQGPPDRADEPEPQTKYVPFGEADEYTLAAADTDQSQTARQLRPEEAAALSTAMRPAKRLVVALPPADPPPRASAASAGSGAPSFGVNDASMLSRLLDMELPFARILLFLTPQSATLLSTAVCRGIRSQAAPLYNRYCRVVVRRLEATASKSHQESGASAALAPSDAPGDASHARGSDGLAWRVWDEVRALVDEAACHSFCLTDGSGTDESAPWRLRTTIATLAEVSGMGDFAVQILAADPGKLKVSKLHFESLDPTDQRLLVDRGVVSRSVSTVHSSSAPVRFTHRAKPAARPIRKDIDVPTQLAACQQQEKEANTELEQLKQQIRMWPPNTKVEVAGEGYVSKGKQARLSATRVTLSCPGGEAAFKRELSVDEQERLEHVFMRPEPLLHVRGHAVGREHSKRGMTVNSSGRALMASFSTSAVDTNGEAVPRLPTHAFGARRRR